jgi:hypothetical protein
MLITCWQAKLESTTFSNLTLHPYFAMMPFDDLGTQIQPYPKARNMGRIFAFDPEVTVKYF